MLIDVHSHVVPSTFPPAKAGSTRWPEVVHFEAGAAHVVIGGKTFRTITEQCWNAERRLSDMATEGVHAQALSPMPELLSYWLSAEECLVLARHTNEFIASLVSTYPGQFHGLGMVPLQDPELAAQELAQIKAMGLVGVEIGSNVLGLSLGEARFLPFFQEAAALGLAVWVHSLHPTFADRLVGPRQVTSAVGFPIDLGLTVASLITGKVTEQVSELRIAFSHGGGSFPFTLPRLEHAWAGGWNGSLAESGAPLRGLLNEAPSIHARRMFYDSLLFDGRAIAYLVEVMGSSQVFIGTDYPFVKREMPVGRTLRTIGLSDSSVEAIEWRNAARFLGIQATVDTRSVSAASSNQ